MFSFFKKKTRTETPASAGAPKFSQLEEALIKSALLEPDNWTFNGIVAVSINRGVFVATHPERGITISYAPGLGEAEICCDHVRGVIGGRCAHRMFSLISETHRSRAERAALLALDKAPTMVEGRIEK